MSNKYDNIHASIHSDHSCTFENYTEFSSDFQDLKHRMSTLYPNLKRSRLFKIEFKNKPGITRIVMIFKNATEKYIILPGMTFEIISNAYDSNSHFSSIYTIKMQDIHTKEIKMTETVNELDEILINSPPAIFSYYN